MSAARLQELLGLDDDELLAVLDAGPLEVVSGDLDHRPELPILLDLLADAEEQAGAPVLQRWVRREGPAGRPIELLLARDFGGLRGRAGDARRARLRDPRRRGLSRVPPPG